MDSRDVLHGRSVLAGEPSAAGARTFRAHNPARGEALEPPFHEAAAEVADRAIALAAGTFDALRAAPAGTIAGLLEGIAQEIEGLGDALIARAARETGLTEDRLRGERGRTVGQLRLFATEVREGSWVEARIDRAIPDRKPLPKPDVRRMLIPIGPVVVFGASNFPIAFSVAGGDTVSALAAANPVVVKAHPAHPGTSELVAGAIARAIQAAGLPAGAFSLVQASDPAISIRLVEHPLARAVGFTGSARAGRALFDAAARRRAPIPVYAEMGSVNPVFVLPGALAERAGTIAQGLVQSFTLGTGQFCTAPGLVVGPGGTALDGFISRLTELVQEAPAGTMLHAGIRRGFDDAVRRVEAMPGVRTVRSHAVAAADRAEASPVVFVAAADALGETINEEIFGPSTMVVPCGSRSTMEEIARSLEGHLTATIHGTADDLREYGTLVAILQDKVGRLIFNGFPTGVEVCPSMHHGGPYPATTDVHFTSVGTAAIKRFARPVCFQNFPQDALPPELKDDNPRGIWRLVDNEWTKN